MPAAKPERKTEDPAKRPVGRPRKHPAGYKRSQTTRAEAMQNDRRKPLTRIDERIFQFIDKLQSDGRISALSDVGHALGAKNPKQIIYLRKTGKNSFTVDDIQKLCDRFEMNPAYIFGYDDNMYRRYTGKLPSS